MDDVRAARDVRRILIRAHASPKLVSLETAATARSSASRISVLHAPAGRTSDCHEPFDVEQLMAALDQHR